METFGLLGDADGKAPRNKVFVVDDDAGIRDSLRLVLELRGYRVDTFESGAHFLASEAVKAIGCVLTDIEMPIMNGLELQAELNRRGARLAIVFMAGRGLVAHAVLAMKAGAIDFLEKPFTEALLLDCIRRGLASLLGVQGEPLLGELAQERMALLTHRERQVLDLVVVGSSNKVVAQTLRISPRTVEIHRARAISKMGARSLPELVRMTIASSLLAA